jgi:uncharacterized protein
MSDVAIRELTRIECLSLLASKNVGQLALTRRALPTVIPARYLLLEDRVLVHASTGLDPVAWVDGEIVALHVEAFDPDLRRGWSVSLTGAAHGTPAIAGSGNEVQAPWIPCGGGDLIAISTDIVWGEHLGETIAQPGDDAAAR